MATRAGSGAGLGAGTSRAVCRARAVRGCGAELADYGADAARREGEAVLAALVLIADELAVLPLAATAPRRVGAG